MHADIPPPRISNDSKMAEVGIIASALQIADIGVRLSLRLYTFGETVASADKSIIAISEHISLTSTVLKELGQTLDKDQTSLICSSNAVKTANNIVKQCQRIFQEMDHLLVKKFANTKSTEEDRRINAAQTLERLKWPFIKGKIDLLMSNLEKQKSTLVLMLNVIALAKQEHERTEPYTIIAEQRSLIEDLAESNEGYVRKFERLKLSCEEAPIDQESVPADWSSSMLTPKIPTTSRLAGALAVDAPSQTQSSADAKGLDRETYKGSDIPSFSSSDRLGWLLQQYSSLLRTLLREVNAPSYEIAEESRSRIRADIILTQRREMKTLSQQADKSLNPSATAIAASNHLTTTAMGGSQPSTSPSRANHPSSTSPNTYANQPTFHEYYPGLPSLANSRTTQMQHPVTTGSRIREYSGSNFDVDQVSAPVQTQHDSMSAYSLSSAPSTSSFTNYAKTRPHIPEAYSWTPANDAQSYIPPPEASPRFPPPGFHSRTVPSAQLHSLSAQSLSLPMSNRTSESRFRRDNSASQSDTLQPFQPQSQGSVTPWQQRGRDDCRNHNEYVPNATHSLLTGRADSGPPSTPQKLDSDSKFIISERPSSGQTSKPRNESASHHPEGPQGGPVPQWGNDSSKRSRFSEVESYAAPATAIEDPPALQSSANDVIATANSLDFSSFSVPNLPIGPSTARHGRTQRRKQSPIRLFEDDGIEGCAEDIVDILLATWTTLPLHASQINPPHGSLTEAAY